ncbi:MAG TPA: ATP-binding protein [Flavisolibacter sp.]|nr:ATP-binding protein [Flavisolibacter sp.]
MQETTATPLDVLSILNSIPGNHLILLPDAPRFTIAGVTDAYTSVTYIKREEVVWQGVFESLTDDPQNAEATGVKNLSASLHYVLEHKREHRMADQRYDVRNPITGQFELKVWSPLNKPVLDSKGGVQYIIHTVEDVTEKVRMQEAEKLAYQKLRDSESRFRSMVEQAPVGILLTRGEEVVIESVNSPMLQFMNKISAEDVIGKKMLEALPELNDQPVLQTVIKVQQTGEPWTGSEVPVDLMLGGKLTRRYYNFSYTAIKENGLPTGVLHVAIDVTEQVQNRQRVEEGSRELQLAIEAANLGTFYIDPQTGKTTYSQRVMDWFGFTEKGLSMEVIPSYVHPDDRPQVIQALENSYRSVANSHHDIAYRVLNPIDGQTRYLRSFGKTYFNQEGKPNAMIGTIQDITPQMKHQQQLEAHEADLQTKVEERTAALGIKNKELERSNTNLEEFAYAASHDMKEPLRKIHFFADRLKVRLADKLVDEDRRYFERLEAGVSRMTTLIDDLLLYSHVNRGVSIMETVDLNQMLSFVMDDLELQIEEKGARVTAGHLPTTQGRPRQLQQLFENLIGNALKYSKPDVAPIITVTASVVKGSDTSLALSAEEANKPFHLIEVQDNGIGFEQADAERIFNVFTRLHGNTEYRGTGVGLSIVQKVVENHGGYIWAEGLPGQGATFKMLLPVE